MTAPTPGDAGSALAVATVSSFLLGEHSPAGVISHYTRELLPPSDLAKEGEAGVLRWLEQLPASLAQMVGPFVVLASHAIADLAKERDANPIVVLSEIAARLWDES